MTREEALRIVNSIDRNILTDEECYVVDNIFELVSPSLPPGLDEAAQKVEDYYDVGEKHGRLCCFQGDIKGAFKAGAGWMAKQGITVTGDTDDEYVRILKDIEEAICKIAPDSTVSVQIRKK